MPSVPDHDLTRVVLIPVGYQYSSEPPQARKLLGWVEAKPGLSPLTEQAQGVDYGET